MSLPANGNNDSESSVYQPSWLVKLLLLVTLVTATFNIPYAVFMNQPETLTAEENGSVDVPDKTTPDDPVKVDSKGKVPSMLTFNSGKSVSSKTTLSIATPYEAGWNISGQDASETNYNYAKLGCNVKTKVIDMEFSSKDDKDASLEVMGSYLERSASSLTGIATVSELTYNLTSTAQFMGVGSFTGVKYEWIYARGISTINKGLIVKASCSTEDQMYETSDNLRSQFGILLKP